MTTIPVADIASAGTDLVTGNVTLTFYECSTADEPRSTTVQVSPEDALDLAANLLAHATTAIRRAAKNAALGDCDLCGNRRLVDVLTREGSDRTTDIHCPRCSTGHVAPFNAPPLRFVEQPAARGYTAESLRAAEDQS